MQDSPHKVNLHNWQQSPKVVSDSQPLSTPSSSPEMGAGLRASLALVLFILPQLSAFYIPGDPPRSYREGDNVGLHTQPACTDGGETVQDPWS
jgi:hypothetical protein